MTQAVESEPEPLNLDILESWLWEAADILRGSIDSADYKNYIFGLMFLKRLSERYQEEAEKFIEEDGVHEDITYEDSNLRMVSG